MKLLHENPEYQGRLYEEARRAYADAKRLGLWGHHRLVSNEFRIKAPSDPDWNYAIGTWYGYGIAEIDRTQARTTIKLTLWRWDPFEFDCDDPAKLRPVGSIGHLHTSLGATDYVNEAVQTRTFTFTD